MEVKAKEEAAEQVEKTGGAVFIEAMDRLMREETEEAKEARVEDTRKLTLEKPEEITREQALDDLVWEIDTLQVREQIAEGNTRRARTSQWEQVEEEAEETLRRQELARQAEEDRRERVREGRRIARKEASDSYSFVPKFFVQTEALLAQEESIQLKRWYRNMHRVIPRRIKVNAMAEFWSLVESSSGMHDWRIRHARRRRRASIASLDYESLAGEFLRRFEEDGKRRPVTRQRPVLRRRVRGRVTRFFASCKKLRPTFRHGRR
ncbi:hypothetical protein HD806DRAFT_552540 [Xylariaceae sp. AK1471]|nr:hypothetical protein HD806DRAFT_552540 [Xylariaceae sp. AK1471]